MTFSERKPLPLAPDFQPSCQPFCIHDWNRRHLKVKKPDVKQGLSLPLQVTFRNGRHLTLCCSCSLRQAYRSPFTDILLTRWSQFWPMDQLSDFSLVLGLMTHIKKSKRTKPPIFHTLRQHSIRLRVLRWAVELDSLMQLGPPLPNYVTPLSLFSHM